MYHVYIRVDPDGDFWYDNSIPGFDRDTKECDLYFKDRDLVTDMIQTFCTTMINSIGTDLKHVKGTVKEIKSHLRRISILVEKFEYLLLELDYGNQCIELCIEEAGPTYKRVEDSRGQIPIYAYGPPRFTDNPIYGYELSKVSLKDIRKLPHYTIKPVDTQHK